MDTILIAPRVGRQFHNFTNLFLISVPVVNHLILEELIEFSVGTVVLRQQHIPTRQRFALADDRNVDHRSPNTLIATWPVERLPGDDIDLA
jgi:hypothetical protein